MGKAWVVRSGKHGEREAWSLANGYAGTGWSDFPDLTPYTSREALVELVSQTLSDAKEGAIPGYAGQLWALRSRIQVGDLMVLPLKTTRQIAVGRVTGDYEFRANELDPNFQHVRAIDWQRTDVPRSAVKQDLLYILGSALTVFAPSNNHAEERLEKLLSDGFDPGQAALMGGPAKVLLVAAVAGDEAVDEPELQPDIEEVAQIQISAKIAEEFSGHALAALVAELLTISGFVCRVSPPGPDGGVDIHAGRGPLGLDDPLLLVQVKSGSQVGAPVIQQLHGAIAQHGATQGLLVAWGGLSKPAREQLINQKMRVRLWEAQEVMDGVLANYDSLSEGVRSRLPLKRVWMLADT